jgi:hypothetical protein
MLFPSSKLPHDIGCIIRLKQYVHNQDVQMQHVEQDVSDILSLGKEHVQRNMLKQDVLDICVGHLAPRTSGIKDSNISKARVSFKSVTSVNV